MEQDKQYFFVSTSEGIMSNSAFCYGSRREIRFNVWGSRA